MKLHAHSTTQLNLPAALSQAVLAVAAAIPAADLADDGRTAEPHITVLYGLATDQPEPVQAALAGVAPIPFTIGPVTVFKTDAADVVKLSIDSPELRALHEKLAAALPHVRTHPTYEPHLTLAYVKPGLGTKYLGNSELTGQTAVADSVRFSNRKGDVTDILLTPPSGSISLRNVPAALDKSRAVSDGPKTTVGTHGDVGHFVTIDGHAVFIADHAGEVPARVKSQHGKRFTRSEIERAMVDHYQATGGGWQAEHDAELEATGAAGGNYWTFKGSLPTEISDHIQGRPELRKLFRVSNDSARTGGADAFGALGDRYLELAELAAGSPVRLAAAEAAKAQDPEVSFLAHVHRHLPKGAKLDKLDPAGLRIGDSFEVNGERYRVAEDADGFRVLRAGRDFQVPLDYLKAVPADRGSFKPGRPMKRSPKPDDGIPFSRAARFDPITRRWVSRPMFDPNSGIWLSAGLFDSPSNAGASGRQQRLDDDGYWRTINGARVHFDGTGKADRGPVAAVAHANQAAASNAPGFRNPDGTIRKVDPTQPTTKRRTPSNKPKVAFHGSPHVFEKFDTNKGGDDTKFGPGAYFTLDKAVATDWATDRGQEGESAHVYTVELSHKRPFDMTKPFTPPDAIRLNRAAVDIGGKPMPPGYFSRDGYSLYQAILRANDGDKAKVRDILQVAGYDAITDGKEIAVFKADAIAMKGREVYGGAKTLDTPDTNEAASATADAKVAPPESSPSAMTANLYGDQQIDSSGIGDQAGMFAEPDHPTAPKPIGSANANDPKHTAEMFPAASPAPAGEPPATNANEERIARNKARALAAGHVPFEASRVQPGQRLVNHANGRETVVTQVRPDGHVHHADPDLAAAGYLGGLVEPLRRNEYTASPASPLSVVPAQHQLWQAHYAAASNAALDRAIEIGTRNGGPDTDGVRFAQQEKEARAAGRSAEPVSGQFQVQPLAPNDPGVMDPRRTHWLVVRSGVTHAWTKSREEAQKAASEFAEIDARPHPSTLSMEQLQAELAGPWGGSWVHRDRQRRLDIERGRRVKAAGGDPHGREPAKPAPPLAAQPKPGETMRQAAVRVTAELQRANPRLSYREAWAQANQAVARGTFGSAASGPAVPPANDIKRESQQTEKPKSSFWGVQQRYNRARYGGGRGSVGLSMVARPTFDPIARRWVLRGMGLGLFDGQIGHGSTGHLWDESQHPRDVIGRFRDKDGSPDAPPVPVRSSEDTHPREEAAARTQAALQSAEYAFARPSAIGNAGEDLLGSARHVRNAWRSLEQAEQEGTAEKLVTRDMLLRNEPHRLGATLDPAHALSHLAAHLALQALPMDPGEKYARHDKDSTPESRRREYYEVFRNLKAVAEEAARQESHPGTVLQRFHDAVRSEIYRLRGQSGTGAMAAASAARPRNAVANALIDTLNRTRPRGTGRANDVMTKVMDFASRLSKAYGQGESNPDLLSKAVDHVADVMEGDSFNKTFGTVSERGREFHPADAYVKHATRAGGPVLDVTSATKATDWLMKEARMRGLQHGNSVSDEERLHHLRFTAESMADLADLTGLPPSAMSHGGKLGIAFGARGKGRAAAHYEPGMRVINLTRANGVGSLAHEWWHSMDHDVGGKHGPSAHSYGTESMLGKTPALATAFKELMSHPAMLRFSRRTRQAIADMEQSGQAVYRAKTGYWTEPKELSARAFERWAQAKLEQQGRKNTYLTGLNDHPLWPTVEETKELSPAFEKVFAAIRQHHVGSENKPVSLARFDAAQRRWVTTPAERTSGGLYLSLCEMAPPVELPLALSGQPCEENGLPVKYFRKWVIAEGKYRHPATGQEFVVTGQRLRRWAETVRQMRKAGRDIPVPVDHSFKAEDNRGWVIDALPGQHPSTGKPALALTLKMIGQDAAELAARNRASIWIEPDFTDETGRHWGDSIVHCALTPLPVITGMGAFEPLATAA